MNGPPGGPLEANTPACEVDRGRAVHNLPSPVEEMWASARRWGYPGARPRPNLSWVGLSRGAGCALRRPRSTVELGNYFVDPRCFSLCLGARFPGALGFGEASLHLAEGKARSPALRAGETLRSENLG